MTIFRHNGPANDPSSSLRLPASKRVSTAASERLTTILESDRISSGGPAPAVPLRSILRNSNTSENRPPPPPWQPHSAHRSAETLRSGPPAYAWSGRSSIGEDEDLTAPVEGEKLARLRRGEEGKTRGGFWRLLLFTIIGLLVIGLAVGLGVGLTLGRRGSSDSTGMSGSITDGSSTARPQQFPLGQYSIITALRSVQTNCSAKPAAWRCYPYSTLSQSNTTSLTPFNWLISNTSDTYAINTTAATSSSGVPANLTITAGNNPFAITFTNQSLTYINDGNNASSQRYTFSFTMQKVVQPSQALTSDNQASTCYYNSTVFAATIYLNAARTYPDTALRNSSMLAGFQQWPYAVEITQTSPGGNGVPDCYTLNAVTGQVGARITDGLTPQAESSTCQCEYNNY